MSEGAMTIDEFKLLSCIATGNFSQVWEVVEQERTEHLALKMLMPQALADPELLTQFKHEAKVCKSINHPNFCEFYKQSITKKQAYFVMEYFRAPSVKYLIMNDIFSIQARMNRFIEGCCLGLGQMHEQGWVHKDVKPDNVLFNRASELRLIDFSLSVRTKGGLAKAFSGKVSNIQGTRTYIAPEVIRRQHAIPQTDMYSLGVTLYEILTGQPPFRGSSPDELLRKHLKEEPAPPSAYNDNIAPEMDRFIIRMLAKKPANRFKDMNELLSDFRTVKIFKEDPLELQAKKKAATGVKGTDELKKRLDSRADAQRKREEAEKTGGAAEPAAKPAAPPTAAKSPPPQQPTPQPPPPAQPAPGAPQQQPGYQPAMQQYPMQGAPGYPMMPQMPGGYPLPQYNPPPGQGGYPGAPFYPGMPQYQQPPYQQPQYQPQPPPQYQQPPTQQPAAPQHQPQPPTQQPAQPQQPQSPEQTPAQQKPIPQGKAAPPPQQTPQPQQINPQKPKRQPLRPQGTVPEQHPSAKKIDEDTELPLMEELPDIL